jgi:hypothetical protein
MLDGISSVRWKFYFVMGSTLVRVPLILLFAETANFLIQNG